MSDEGKDAHFVLWVDALFTAAKLPVPEVPFQMGREVEGVWPRGASYPLLSTEGIRWLAECFTSWPDWRQRIHNGAFPQPDTWIVLFEEALDL